MYDQRYAERRTQPLVHWDAGELKVEVECEGDKEHDVEPKVEAGVPRHPGTRCRQLFRCNGGSHEVFQRMCTTRTVGAVRKSGPRIPQEDRKNPTAGPTSYRVLAEAFV